jgi:hypothetical protein
MTVVVLEDAAADLEAGPPYPQAFWRRLMPQEMESENLIFVLIEQIWHFPRLALHMQAQRHWF